MTLGAARVIWSLMDLSMFVDEVSLGYVTMVIKAERGPIGRSRIISSMDEYRRIFGLKVPYTTDPLVCEMALRQGGRLNLIRTAHYGSIADPSTLTALKASATIADRGASISHGYIEGIDGPYTFRQACSGTVTGTVEGPFEITLDSTDIFSVKLRQSGVWGSALTKTLTAGTRSASQVAAEIATLTGVSAEAINGKVKVYATAVEDDLEISAISHDAYSILGFTEGQSFHTDGEDFLELSVDGGADQQYTLVYNSTYSGRTTTSNAGTYTITDGVDDQFSMRVRHAGTWGNTQTITISDGVGLTASAVAAEIAALDGVSASVTSTNKILIFATDVLDDIEILEVSEDCYTILGLETGVYQATPTIQPGATFTLTPAQVATQINDAGLTGATAYVVNGRLAIRTAAAGTASSVQIKNTSTAASKLGFDYELHQGFEGFEEATITIRAKDEGEWGNNLKIFIYDSALNPLTHFDLKVVHTRQGGMNEWYSNLSMDSLSDRYFVNFINERSMLIEVEDEASSNDFYTNVGWINRPKLSDTVLGVDLTGGDNGLDGFTDYDWIGDSASSTGMYAADSAHMSMDLMIPGSTSATVYQALISYCLNRADMISYGQVPYGLDPEDAVDWRLGNAPWSHPAFNSHRFALFYGRPLVYDDMDDTRKYISCLGHLASCLCRTDNNYGPSWAPVGPRRGTVTLVEDIDFDVQTNRSTGYADLFAENGINYLMISRYKGIEGAMFWEQRTTQRAASATRELNVVRFITMMNRALMPVLRTFIFEPNHPVTWREIHRTLEPAFEDWKNKYAIYDYALQTDRDAWWDGGVLKNAVLNSGLDIDKGIYHCRALIQPTRAILYLEFELAITRTGQAFETYMDLRTLPGWIRE